EELAAAKASPHAIPARAIPAAVVQGFPTDPQAAREAAKRLIDRKPSGLISIERHGANAKGVYHYGRGEANKNDMVAKVEALFEEGKSRGVLTIGIGDGGNELGMGRIQGAIRQLV